MVEIRRNIRGREYMSHPDSDDDDDDEEEEEEDDDDDDDDDREWISMDFCPPQ